MICKLQQIHILFLWLNREKGHNYSVFFVIFCRACKRFLIKKKEALESEAANTDLTDTSAQPQTENLQIAN